METGTLFILQKLPQAVLSIGTDGSGLKTIVGGLDGEPDGIQVDTASNTIYWTNMGVDITAADGAIDRSDLDGRNFRRLVGDGLVVTPKQLKLDPEKRHLYFCDREGMRVMRARTDGSDVTVLVRTGIYPTDMADEMRWCVGIAIDAEGGHLYWSQKGPKNGGKGRIFRAGLVLPHGEAPDNRSDVELVLNGLPEPIDLDFDRGSRRLYWTDRGNLKDGNTLNYADFGADGVVSKVIVAHELREGIGISLDPAGGRAFITDLSGAVRVSSWVPGGSMTTIAQLGPLTGIAFVES